MTSQDNLRDFDELRDRIAKVLYGRSTHFAVYKRTWDEEMEGTEGDSDEIDSIRDDAQAIIDELGLTNEWSFRFEGKDRRYSLNRAEDLRTIGLYGPLEDAAIESRVVGKWVEQ